MQEKATTIASLYEAYEKEKKFPEGQTAVQGWVRTNRDSGSIGFVSAALRPVVRDPHEATPAHIIRAAMKIFIIILFFGRTAIIIFAKIQKKHEPHHTAQTTCGPPQGRASHNASSRRTIKPRRWR